MKFKYKPNYFLATLGGGLEFDSNGEYTAANEVEVEMLKGLGATEVIEKKNKKK